MWLCRIAKNCFYDRLKKSERTETLDDALPLSVDGPEAQVLLHDGAERARTVLHGIAEPYREVFMWLNIRKVRKLGVRHLSPSQVSYQKQAGGKRT